MSKEVERIIAKRQNARHDANVCLISKGNDPYRNQHQLINLYAVETDILATYAKDGADEDLREKATQELMLDCQKLVKKNALRFKSRIVDTGKAEFQDIVQAGNLGVLESIKTFDASKGRFTSYIVYELRNYFADFVAECNIIYIPTNQQKAKERINIAIDILRAVNREVNPANVRDVIATEKMSISNEVSLSDENIQRLIDVDASLEIDANFGGDTEEDKMEWRSDDEVSEHNLGMAFDDTELVWKRQLCEMILNCEYITELDKEILERYFGFNGQPEPLKEIAKGKVIRKGKNKGKPMTAQHVNNYVIQAIKRLQKNMASLGFLAEV